MYTLDKTTVITPEVIKSAIASNEKQAKRYEVLRKYYLGEHIILKRTKRGALKNNTVMVNHAKYIIDLNIGYLLGNPIEYQYAGDEGNETKDKPDTTLDPVLEEYRKQTISDIDSELAKEVAIYGKAFTYSYAVEDNSVKTAVIKPTNAICVYDNTMEHKKLFAIYYSEKLTNGKYESVKVVTPTEIIDYKEDFIETGRVSHGFLEVPIVEYRNNPEEKGDFEQVITLINAYNTLQSDRVNDKEQLVEALLVFYGVKLTASQLEELKENRVVTGLPPAGKAEYLVKQLNEADVDILRKVIESDIFKISMTPNMTDENFVGNASGVALKYKLLPLEQNTKNKERFLAKGLLERFRLYNNYLNNVNKSVPLVPTYDIDVIFKRNLPQNDFETSQMIINLAGLVSKESLVGQLSFIDDATDEVKWADEQKVADMNLESKQFGTDNPTDNPKLLDKTNA